MTGISIRPTLNTSGSTLLGQQQKRNQVLASGPGSHQVYGDITGSQFGQNHPLAGKLLGGLAQVGSTIGDIALSAVRSVIPRLASSGSSNPRHDSAHHGALLGQEDKNINQMQGEQQKTAQTGLENAPTENLENPNQQALATEQGYQAYNPKTGQAKPITGQQGQELDPIEKPSANAFQHVALPDGSVVALSRGPDGKITADEVFKGDPKTQPQKSLEAKAGTYPEKASLCQLPSRYRKIHES